MAIFILNFLNESHDSYPLLFLTKIITNLYQKDKNKREASFWNFNFLLNAARFVFQR